MLPSIFKGPGKFDFNLDEWKQYLEQLGPYADALHHEFLRLADGAKRAGLSDAEKPAFDAARRVRYAAVDDLGEGDSDIDRRLSGAAKRIADGQA